MLAYGQSEYVRHFGMNVETAAGPLSTQARILKPPTLQYGQGSKELKIVNLSKSYPFLSLTNCFTRSQGMGHGTCTWAPGILKLTQQRDTISQDR